jgi:hypothetical protein
MSASAVKRTWLAEHRQVHVILPLLDRHDGNDHHRERPALTARRILSAIPKRIVATRRLAM